VKNGGKRQRTARGTMMLAFAAVMLLGGCGEGDKALASVTLNEREATLYQHSCKTCHEDAATGAPLTHDTAAWAPRMAKGDDALLESIVNGFNGMPPLGQCIECDGNDFMVLTRFMAAPAGEDEAGETVE
jgi:cytochrome c5